MNFKEKIDTFLNTKSNRQKIIVVYGPTASGKTGLSIEIAKYINSEIISTDSRQIFKELDIGTGKVTEEETEGIPHYMLDFIEPNNEYSVGEYKVEAEKYILDIFNSNKVPILCGGTGLYIDSLIYDFNIPNVPADEDLRNELENLRLEKGNQYIWDILKDIDPEYALELHPNNHRYVIRAIEVKKLTGKSKRDFRTEKKSKYDTLFITPYNGDREYLYNRINKRVGMMFDDGLINEVKELLNKYDKSDFGMKTIGYKEVVEHLEGTMTEEECIELVKKHNRNYAKRQLTWFNKYES